MRGRGSRERCSRGDSLTAMEPIAPPALLNIHFGSFATHLGYLSCIWCITCHESDKHALCHVSSGMRTRGRERAGIAHARYCGPFYAEQEVGGRPAGLPAPGETLFWERSLTSLTMAVELPPPFLIALLATCCMTCSLKTCVGAYNGPASSIASTATATAQKVGDMARRSKIRNNATVPFATPPQEIHIGNLGRGAHFKC